ncbi:MAG: response regulator receiver domain protein (CheY-like) [Parcubacteria group bacterium GW2011_GWA1_47_8]|nr:MAG: response regulator receiver domain protein (CheY-like) [Parcubacteria group bacterium GW2011_GWA1_47_8]
MDEKKKIIIVEDDAILRDVLFEKLERSGFSVDRAEDGIIAMEKIRARRPDMILLDIIMPRKGGMQVLEELHADPALKDIPIIIISNSGQPVEVERARELGARDFLIKAVFDPNEVLEKVKNILEGKDQGKAGWDIRTQMVGGVAEGTTTPAPVASVAQAPVATPGQSTSGSASAQTPVNAPTVFILVVEDDKFLRELLVRKLLNEGFVVENAIEARVAFEILEKKKPSIILLDLILPGVSGFEILARIKEDPKLADVPVIILSNLGQKEDVDRAMALGAKDFMVKANFTLDEIVTKVRTVTGV